jgi:hypothetical protein
VRARLPCLASAAAVAALLLMPSFARADVTRDQCIDANAKAQDLRRDHKLAAAREQLRVCSNAACPAMVQSDCTKRLDELEGVQPTVAFEVKDAAGADLTAVKVTVDGVLLTSKLDGTSYALDPGSHTSTFEAAGLPPVTRAFVLTEGDKGRHERVALGSPTTVESGPVPAAPTLVATEPGPTNGMGTRKILGLVSGGVGVAGIAVGSIFGAMALSQKSAIESTCATTCTSSMHSAALSDHSNGVTDGAVSTVGFIAGGALLVGGAVLFFTGGKGPANATTGTQIVPSVGPGGGGMFVKGVF